MLSIGTALYALAMLGLVLGLILGLGWILRTYGSRWGLSGAARRAPTLQVQQRLTLSAHHSLVEVTDTTSPQAQRYLIVLGPNHSTVVAQERLKQKAKV